MMSQDVMLYFTFKIINYLLTYLDKLHDSDLDLLTGTEPTNQ